MREAEIDFGIFDPNRTDVICHQDGWFAILKDKHTGREIVQRKDNTFQSVLAFTCLFDPVQKQHKKLSVMKDSFGAGQNFWLALTRLREDGIIHSISRSLEMLLMKHRRETPPGVEWNAPGGILHPRENARDGMARELQEEVSGLTILGTTIFSVNQCYASGSFREFYSLGAVLAYGDPERSETEKGDILALTRIPLHYAYNWIQEQNEIPLNNPSRCGVDGKVMETFLHLERGLKTRKDW